jgi:hypothetical protein
MSACFEVKKAIVENVQVPVEQFVTKFQEVCEEFKTWWTEEVQQPVEQWVGQWQQTCVEQDCNWWCACCNKWLCWLAWVVVKVVTWVVVTVVKWAVYWVCKVVSFVVKIIVMVLVAIIKWVVVFVVCLFTDPIAALKSFRDLWNDLLDIGEEIVDFAKSLIDDVGNLLSDVQDLVSTLLQGILGVAEINYVSAVIAGLFRWIIQWVRDGVDVVRDLICNIQDLVFGILRLNWCRIVAGLAGIGGDVVRVIMLVLRIPGGIVGGPKEEYELNEVERIVDQALVGAFAGDPAGLKAARKKVALRNRPFGVPIHIDARRFFISSRSSAIDLQSLDKEGIINLSAAADLATGCEQRDISEGPRGEAVTGDRSSYPLDRPRWDVVYAGTDSPVDYQTIEGFRDQGPNAVPEFRVYAIRKEMFRRYLEICVRKGQQIGIRFTYAIGDYEVTQMDEVPVPDTDAGNDAVMTRAGRNGVNDDLCRPPGVAIFRYTNPKRTGLTSWFRPAASDTHPSGVTFRDRLPEAMFRFTLIHELGHYFGLDHAGHNGIGFIMFTNDPGAGLDTMTWDAFFQVAVLTGEPRFSTDDARTSWQWITSTARGCLS